MRKEQFWLVELDKYDNPDLIDGSHSDYDGANEALYLRKRMGFYKKDKRYAVARIELLECTDKKYEVNEEAISNCNEMLDNYRTKRGIL